MIDLVAGGVKSLTGKIAGKVFSISGKTVGTEPVASSKQEVSGGPHRQTSKPANDGLDSHHCPAKSCYKAAPISSNDGPAIKMDPKDHESTASHGNGDAAKAYREQQKALLQQGKLQEAVDMDINDIRSKFGTKYDEAIEQMQDYVKTLNPNDFMPK